MNMPVRDGKFEFVVTGVQPGLAEVGDNPYLTKKAQGQFVIVTVTVKNIGDKPQFSILLRRRCSIAMDAASSPIRQLRSRSAAPTFRSGTTSTPATRLTSRLSTTCHRAQSRPRLSCMTRCSRVESRCRLHAEPQARGVPPVRSLDGAAVYGPAAEVAHPFGSVPPVSQDRTEHSGHGDISWTRAPALTWPGYRGHRRTGVHWVLSLYTPAVGGSIPSAPTSQPWRAASCASCTREVNPSLL